MDEAVAVELLDEMDDGVADAVEYASARRLARGSENVVTHLSFLQSTSASPASVTKR